MIKLMKSGILIFMFSPLVSFGYMRSVYPSDPNYEVLKQSRGIVDVHQQSDDPEYKKQYSKNSMQQNQQYVNSANQSNRQQIPQNHNFDGDSDYSINPNDFDKSDFSNN